MNDWDANGAVSDRLLLRMFGGRPRIRRRPRPWEEWERLFLMSLAPSGIHRNFQVEIEGLKGVDTTGKTYAELKEMFQKDLVGLRRLLEMTHGIADPDPK